MNTWWYLRFLSVAAIAVPSLSNSHAKETKTAASRHQVEGKIVFSRTDDKDHTHLYAINSDGSHQTLLIKNFGAKQDYSFRADGRAIVLAGSGNQNVFYAAKSNDIFLMKISSKKPFLLYDKLYAYSPAFSADGQYVTFSAGIYDHYTRQFAIWKMKSDGSEVTRLTGTSNSALFFSNGTCDQTPAFTPDGKKIIFSSSTNIQSGTDAAYGLHMKKTDFFRRIHIMNADGSNLIDLTDASSTNYDPAVSPDGKRIAFVSKRDGNAEIYVMNIDGSAQTRLTASSAADFQPTWSPDGTMIAWVSNSTGTVMATDAPDPHNEIYVMRADGSEQERLTRNHYGERKPLWLKAVPVWKLHRNLSYVPTEMLSPNVKPH